jgi:NAD+ synthase (glutamine-hydrolysing)
MKQFKVALGQMRVIPGQPTKNFLTLSHLVQEAKTKGADMIAFPELCITGYLIGDQFLDNNWVDFAVSFNNKIKALSKDIVIIWGNVVTLGEKPTITNNDSRLAKLNAALIAYQGEYVKRANGLFDGVYPKRLFPNYRIFDDQRYFLPGRELEEKLGWKVKSLLEPFVISFPHQTVSIGLEVCEDMWDAAYGFSPSREYLKQGVDILINISSSPWTLDKEISRQQQIQAHAKVPFVFVNKVGADNNGKNIVLFEGGSMVYDENAKLIASCNEHAEQELLISDLQTSNLAPTPKNKLYTMLIQGIKMTDALLFESKVPWIVGLSGGIDSAVSTTLLTHAIGKDRVFAYSLPTQYNQQQTKENAKKLAQSLGIAFQEISIEPLFQAFLALQPKADTLTQENIQARIRGNLLMNLAAEKRGVVLNNSNKIEVAIGYATLYGDTIGALSPLGDLTKLQIVELARYLNDEFDANIPENLIATFNQGVPTFDLLPSAELKTKQVDPMKWGYHDWLVHELLSFPSLAPERILTMFLDNTFPPAIRQLIQHYQLEQGQAFVEDLEWILRLWNRAYFKRVQMPPNIIVSRGAFGYDYREAQMPYEQTLLFKTLKEKITREHLSPITD